MAYDFTTLSPDDFESLAADLLSHDWGIWLEAFKPGKDTGIDLRNTRVLTTAETTIVQCKRYAAHKFPELLRAVKAEKKKLDGLKPDRYVLVTSVGLTPGNKDALVSALEPWCKSPQDIYGATEVNALLRAHPEVERAHFKLWIASTAVLERVLHSRIFNITQATVESTKAHLSRIVMHEGFNRALSILHQDHHVLIVGIPGIGKTTLARILLCHYLREGFEPLCVTGNIDDAWDLANSSAGTERKMVVLYDDFLGRYRFDSQRFGKNEELSLLEFLNKVRRSPNLRLIFTTREYTLADAQRVHGAFASHAREILKCTLTLEDYSKMHRAKMLFNHLYFSDLPDSRLTRLVKNKVYRKIVEHTHFNPRIVETISTHANSRALSDDEYIQFIQREFDNPSGIWEHPFRNDISPMARTILTVLWTFGGTAELEMLKSACRRMHGSERVEDFTLQFTDGLRQLDGNFIATNRYPAKWGNEDFLVAQFHNPSVEEFIDTLLQSEPAWLDRLTNGIVCFRQVREVTSHASGEKRRQPVPLSFWTAARKAGASTEHIHGGYLINYQHYGQQVRRVWDQGEPDRPRQTLVRLQIESEAKQEDALFSALQMRVLTQAGWLELIQGIQHDDSLTYGVESLHEWVMKNSGWSEATKEACHAAFRAAVAQFLEDEDEAWTCSVCSLRVLAEAVSFGERPMTEGEKACFFAAGKLVVKTITENSESADDVRGEADELASLEKICGVKLANQVAELQAYADGLSERSSERQSDDPETKYITKPSPDQEFDLDFLFTGLLDR